MPLRRSLSTRNGLQVLPTDLRALADALGVKHVDLYCGPEIVLHAEYIPRSMKVVNDPQTHPQARKR